MLRCKNRLYEQNNKYIAYRLYLANLVSYARLLAGMRVQGRGAGGVNIRCVSHACLAFVLHVLLENQLSTSKKIDFLGKTI